MFKIGDFSRLSLVSVRMLRYYDEFGLLAPAHIDRFTDYRYYTVDQLPRLNRILALQDLGFTLQQIKQVLQQDVTADQLRGMLRLKSAEIEQQVQTSSQRLARVEARIRQIEQEGKMPAYDVVIKKLPPQLVAATRRVLPSYTEVGPLIGETFAFVAQQGGRPAGPPVCLYHDPEFRETDVDVEVIVPLAAPLVGSGPVSVRELAGIEQAACLAYTGAYDGIGAAYNALMAWIGENGYRPSGPCREVYLRGPESGSDASTYLTEIVLPVQRA
jgi:DNA-binding transcriptional MerR regulator